MKSYLPPEDELPNPDPPNPPLEPLELPNPEPPNPPLDPLDELIKKEHLDKNIYWPLKRKQMGLLALFWYLNNA